MREYKDFRSVPVMRTLRLPGPLWQTAKEAGQGANKPLRQLLEEAVQTMPEVVRGLREAGLRGEWAHDKLVRIPLSSLVLEALKHGHEQTGLPQAHLLALALYRWSQGVASAANASATAKPRERSTRRRGKGRRKA